MADGLESTFSQVVELSQLFRTVKKPFLSSITGLSFANPVIAFKS